MPRYVSHGAPLRCSNGSAPASLQVERLDGPRVNGRPLALVSDHRPQVNVPAFGMCFSRSNPQVAAATAAAQGVLTPQPCAPVIDAPWRPGARILRRDGASMLTDESSCACAWGGVIEVVEAGQSLAVEVSR